MNILPAIALGPAPPSATKRHDDIGLGVPVAMVVYGIIVFAAEPVP
jgi:hypothetical protein